MKSLPAFASLVLLVACTDRGLTDIEIVRRYCILKGDTLGIITVRRDGVVTQCIALLAEVDLCDTIPLVRRPHTPCVVGQRAA